MSALDYEEVWEKSRAVIRRALAARDGGDFDSFCLWAAVSLELLGKAVLSDIHPALIADPKNPASLFLACGKAVSADPPRTIPAHTVWERLKKLSKGFGQQEASFCKLMMERRNAELHSGALPFQALEPDNWAPRFWKVANAILTTDRKTIEDWVGVEEAHRAQDLINKASTVRQQVVTARLQQSHEIFAARYATDEKKAQIRQLASSGRLVQRTEFGRLGGDYAESQECPSCGCDGVRTAEHAWEQEADEVDWESGTVPVTAYYSPLAFRCAVCNLVLEGHEEVAAADMGDEIGVEEEREVEYESEYGNE